MVTSRTVPFKVNVRHLMQQTTSLDIVVTLQDVSYGWIVLLVSGSTIPREKITFLCGLRLSQESYFNLFKQSRVMFQVDTRRDDVQPQNVYSSMHSTSRAIAELDSETTFGAELMNKIARYNTSWKDKLALTRLIYYMYKQWRKIMLEYCI